MLCNMKKSFYFCGVKSYLRYIAAALCSVFCARNLLVNSSRKVWGNGNVPKVFADVNLTAPIAASFMSKLNICV